MPPAPGHLRSSLTPPGPLLQADCRPLRVISGARSLRPGYYSGPIAGPLRVISGARSLRPGYCSGLIAARSGSSPELVHSARPIAPGRSPPAPGHLRSLLTPPGPLLRADCRPLRVISRARSLRPGHCSGPITARSESSPELVHSARATALGRLPPAPGHLRSSFTPPGPLLRADCRPLRVISRAHSLRPGHCSGPTAARSGSSPEFVHSAPGHRSGPITARSGSSPELVHSARATAPGRLPPAACHLRSSFHSARAIAPGRSPPAPGHLQSSIAPPGPLLRADCRPLPGHLRSSFTPPGLLLRVDCRPLRIISGARSLRPGHRSGPIATRSGSSPEFVHSAWATAPGRLPPAPGQLQSSFTPPGLLLRADCRPLRVISGSSYSPPGLLLRAVWPSAPGHLRSSCSLSGPLLRPVFYPYSGLSVVDTSLSVIYPMSFYLIAWWP